MSATKLTYPALRRIAAMEKRSIQRRVIARVMKISPTTLYDAIYRRGAYVGVP
jgi:hypothetical protein